MRGPPPARQPDLVHVREIDQPGGPVERLLAAQAEWEEDAVVRAERDLAMPSEAPRAPSGSRWAASYNIVRRMPVGYSGTPLLQKLGIKPGHRVWLLSAPSLPRCQATLPGGR